eukprot:GFUD01032893.1.p1 GENE.GFUD01032893.1~~GFUD01032893.1.p1  ORF type:complete len:428 (+),score=114.78 GFUD01032893.1:54-1337(+)
MAVRVVVTFVILCVELCLSDTKRLHPVVLVPGNGGSQVEGRINKTEVVHYVCSKTSDWFTMWLNLELMIPEVIDCWVDNVKLKYDNVTHKTSNNDGVEVRIPGFGNTTTVEWLDPSQRFFSIYFSKIVAKLVLQGYERGVNLHGAPYDFRKAANEQEEYFENIKRLIESTYSTNGNISVILLTHSMGSPMMLYFLNSQSQSWKDKHIRCLTTLAGPWGGAVEALKVFAVGDNFGAWLILNEKKLMGEQRTSPGLSWLMPTTPFWNSSEVLVETAEKNYTVEDYEQFFNDLEEPNGWLMREDTAQLIAGLPAPGVEVFCLHGSGVDTVEKLVYKAGEFPGSDPSIVVKGDGDGTVNTRSLLGCRRWQEMQEKPVHHHVFQGVSHLGILREDPPTDFIDTLINIVNDDLNMEQDEFTENEIIPIIEVLH